MVTTSKKRGASHSNSKDNRVGGGASGLNQARLALPLATLDYVREILTHTFKSRGALQLNPPVLQVRTKTTTYDVQ